MMRVVVTISQQHSHCHRSNEANANATDLVSLLFLEQTRWRELMAVCSLRSLRSPPRMRPHLSFLFQSCLVFCHHFAQSFMTTIVRCAPPSGACLYWFVRTTPHVNTHAQDAGKMTEEEVHVVTWDILFGMTDTTATTKEWLIYWMVNHPEVQCKVHAELDAAIGPDRWPTLADREALPYLWAVVKEVSAQRPAAGPLLHRPVLQCGSAALWVSAPRTNEWSRCTSDQRIAQPTNGRGTDHGFQWGWVQ